MSTRLYGILGLGVDADEIAIRRAYKQLTALHDPAKVPGDAKVAERHRGIQLAYEVLSDEERRALYDEFGDASLKKGFDPEAARRAIEKQKREAARRAKAAMLAPTAVERREPVADEAAAGGGAVRSNWVIEVAIGPQLARRGGALKVPVTRPVPCPRCEGSGRRAEPCPSCRGQLQVSARLVEPCAGCHGIGLTGTRVYCKGCRGSGRRGGRRCARCSGVGIVVQRLECGACAGRGLRVIEQVQPCAACHSTGRAACKRCDGRRTTPKTLALRLCVPPRVMEDRDYRYAGAGFSAREDAPSDLFVRFTVLARAPRGRY